MKRIIALILSCCVGFSAVAEENHDIQGAHEIFREKIILKNDGTQEKIREQAKNALPGEELVGVLTYEYLQDKEADNSILTMALQKEFIYVEGSATDEDYVWFSVDGGKTYARFADLIVTDKEGTSQKATGKDVTHLQWRHPHALNKGDSGTLEYRVTIR